MKKTIFLICLAVNILCSYGVHAQYGWNWLVGNKTPQDEILMDAWSITADPQGNIVVAGYMAGDSVSLGTHKLYDRDTDATQIFISKLDTGGNFLWAISSQGPSDVWFPNVVTDATGNVYVYGTYFFDTLAIDTFTLLNPLQYIMGFLMKVSPYGEVLWLKQIAPLCDTNWGAVANSGACDYGGIGIDSSGYVYVTGTFVLPSITIGSVTLVNNDPSDLTNDVFIAKFDSAGNVVWAERYGGPGEDEAYAIEIAHGGDIFTSGRYGIGGITMSGTTLTDSLNYFAKFDNNGSLLWAKNLPHSMFVSDMTADAQENVYLTGGITANTTIGLSFLIDSGLDNNFFVAKYSGMGDALWGRSVIDTVDGDGFSVSLDPFGNVWTTGNMSTHVNFDGAHTLARIRCS